MPLNLRDAGDLGLRFHGRWGIQLGVPAHQGEAGFEYCVGGEDAEAHGSYGRQDQHHQIKKVLHTSPSQRGIQPKHLQHSIDARAIYCPEYEFSQRNPPR